MVWNSLPSVSQIDMYPHLAAGIIKIYNFLDAGIQNKIIVIGSVEAAVHTKNIVVPGA